MMSEEPHGYLARQLGYPHPQRVRVGSMRYLPQKMEGPADSIQAYPAKGTEMQCFRVPPKCMLTQSSDPHPLVLQATTRSTSPAARVCSFFGSQSGIIRNPLFFHLAQTDRTEALIAAALGVSRGKSRRSRQCRDFRTPANRGGSTRVPPRSALRGTDGRAGGSLGGPDFREQRR